MREFVDAQVAEKLMGKRRQRPGLHDALLTTRRAPGVQRLAAAFFSTKARFDIDRLVGNALHQGAAKKNGGKPPYSKTGRLDQYRRE